jgi:hypothetical protein
MRQRAMATVLAVAGFAVACSAPAEDSPGPSAPPAPTSTSVVPSVGHGSLAYCLSQHGMPAPPGPTTETPAGVDPAAWEKAMAECASLAPGPAN